MRNLEEPKLRGLSEEVTLAVLPRLYIEELILELNRRNIDTNNNTNNKERLANILKDVMVLEYKECEEEDRSPSPEVIDITDSSKTDDNPQALQQSPSTANKPTEEPTLSATGDGPASRSVFRIADSNIGLRGEYTGSTSRNSTPMPNNNDNESVVCSMIDVDAPEKYLDGLSEIFPRSERQSPPLESVVDITDEQDDSDSNVRLVRTHQSLNEETDVYPVMLIQRIPQQNGASSDQEGPVFAEEYTSIGQNDASERDSDCEVIVSESEHQRIMRVISQAKAQVQNHLAGKGRKSFVCTECGFEMYSKFNLLRHQQRRKHTGHRITVSDPNERRESSNVGNTMVNGMTRKGKKCFVCGVCGIKTSSKYNLIRHMKRKKHKVGQAAAAMPSLENETLQEQESNAPVLATSGENDHETLEEDESNAQAINNSTAEKETLQVQGTNVQVLNTSVEQEMLQLHEGNIPGLNNSVERETLQVHETNIPVLDTSVATAKGRKRFACDDCGYKSSQKSNVLRHKRRKHSGQTATTTTENLFQEERLAENVMSSEKESLPLHDSNINVEAVEIVDRRAKKLFICVECGYETPLKANLSRHKKRKHTTGKSGAAATTETPSQVEGLNSSTHGKPKGLQIKKLFTCVECGYQTPLRPNLERHKKRKHTVQITTTETLSQEEGLDSNVEGEPKRVQSKKLFTCVECGYQTPLRANLTRHKKRRHTTGQTTTATPPPPTTGTLSQEEGLNCKVEIRLQKMQVKKLYACVECGYQTPLRANLERHKKRKHTVQTTETVTASTASTETLSQDEVLKEKEPGVTKQVTSSKRKNVFYCEVCGIRCATKYNLKRHKKRHITQNSHEPSENGSRSLSETYTSTDFDRNGPETQNNIEDCVNTNDPTSVDANYLVPVNANDLAGINANDLKSMNTNYLVSVNASDLARINSNDPTSVNTSSSVSTNSRNCAKYTCPLCDYTSAYRVTMRFHKQIHTGERPFMCGTCGHRTTKKALLAKHMRIHTGEKPFACEQCDYRAVQKAHLKRHVRSKHATDNVPQ
ncbi:zinc finger protein 658B-like [Branchiostoma lanceolatum]|uniref:zinc finger protein 658B-like n=1 Tax=Branchiostoma lanceolatum TaxID=7740 RepID=UPI0034562D44